MGLDGLSRSGSYMYLAPGGGGAVAADPAINGGGPPSGGWTGQARLLAGMAAVFRVCREKLKRGNDSMILGLRGVVSGAGQVAAVLVDWLMGSRHRPWLAAGGAATGLDKPCKKWHSTWLFMMIFEVWRLFPCFASSK